MSKWKIYVCEECMVHFAVDVSNIPLPVCCVCCGDHDEVTSTGEHVEGETK